MSLTAHRSGLWGFGDKGDAHDMLFCNFVKACIHKQTADVADMTILFNSREKKQRQSQNKHVHPDDVSPQSNPG